MPPTDEPGRAPRAGPARHLAACSLVLAAYLVGAETASINGRVSELSLRQENTPYCTVLLDSAPMDHGLDCPEDRITLECTETTGRAGQPAAPLADLQTALARDILVELLVTDDRQQGGHCHATRVLLHHSPFTDPDSDHDGVPDLEDDVPLDATETADADDDGTGDAADPDDDNDGVLDSADAFPFDPGESTDTDGGGLGDNADADDDNDGVPDAVDAFPLDPDEFADIDRDGIGDRADTDDDGDGLADVDTDGDGIGDSVDPDDDEDAVPDDEDAFPTGHRDFPLADGIGDPYSIVFANSTFHVVDRNDLVAYAYSRAGERTADADIPLEPANGDPVGITYADNVYYVGDGAARKVYAYETNGRRNPASDFHLADDQDDIKGIAYAGSALYVADLTHVRAYTIGGQRTARLDFPLEGLRSGRVVGLAYAEDADGGIFYVTTRTSTGGATGWRGAAYPVDGDSFLFSFPRQLDSLDAPRGIAIADDRLFVVDRGRDLTSVTNVRAFERGGRRPTRAGDSDFTLEAENGNPSSAAYVERTFYVLDGIQHRIYVYESQGASVPGSVVNLHPTDDPERPPNRWRGLVYADERFFTVANPISNVPNARILAYSRMGQLDHHASFDLIPDQPTRAAGLAVGDQRFYVVGCGPCGSDGESKVYAYSSAGDREPTFDIDLDPDDRYPWGIAMRHDAIRVGVTRVTPTWHRVLSAYGTSGQRIPSLDIDLRPSNDAPTGIAAADAFYVVDARASPGTAYAYLPLSPAQSCERPYGDTTTVFGNPVVQIYQGPLVAVWNATTCTRAEYSPAVAFRDAVTVFRVTHAAPIPPRVHASIGRIRLPIENRRSTVSDTGLRTTSTTFLVDGALLHDVAKIRFASDPRLDADSDYADTIDITVEATALPPLRITFIPIQHASSEPAIRETDRYMTAIHDFFPLAVYRATVGPRLRFTGQTFTPRDAAQEVLHRWYTEADNSEYYHGIFNWTNGKCGYAFTTAHVAVSAAIDSLPNRIPCPNIHAHEFGHNLTLRHAPCGNPSDLDADFPYPNAGIGPRRGWLLSERRFVAPSDHYDIMSYCNPNFVSDYHYDKAFRYVARMATNSSPSRRAPLAHLIDNARQSAAATNMFTAPDHPSLAVSGRIRSNGSFADVRLNPSRMPPIPPPQSSPFTLEVHDADRRVLHAEPLLVHSGDDGEARAFGARLPLVADARYLVVRAATRSVILTKLIDLPQSSAHPRPTQ